MVGGIESYVLGIGRELSELGHQIHVYTPDSVLGQRIEGRYEEIDGIHVHRIHVSFDASYRLRFWPELTNALIRNNHDLVHVYSHDSYALSAAKAAEKDGIPFLITTYGPFATHSDYGFLKGSLLRAYDFFVTPSLLRRCASVLIRYPEILEWVQSFGLSRDSVRLEPSGIPRTYLSQVRNSSFKEQVGRDGPLVLYLGRLSPQKGIRYAIEAMKYVAKKVPQAKLVMAGPDYSGYSAYLRQMIRKLDLADNVILLDVVTDETKEAQVIASCDVFVMPSSFEGFSQAVMKAMAQGRPVVVSDVGGLPYEVDYGRCGAICEYGNSWSLATSILQLIENPGMAAEMGTEGRTRAESFTFDRLAQSISDMYNELIQ